MKSKISLQPISFYLVISFLLLSPSEYRKQVSASLITALGIIIQSWVSEEKVSKENPYCRIWQDFSNEQFSKNFAISPETERGTLENCTPLPSEITDFL